MTTTFGYWLPEAVWIMTSTDIPLEYPVARLIVAEVVLSPGSKVVGVKLTEAAAMGTPLMKTVLASNVAGAVPVFLTTMIISYPVAGAVAGVAYALTNWTFSYRVRLDPRPSSQYATAMDMVIAMATMMMVAMTGLTAFRFPLKVLRSFIDFHLQQSLLLIFLSAKTRDFSLLDCNRKSR